MTLKQRFARSFRIFGFDLTRYLPDRHPEAQISKLMDTYGINLVLDVGANEGQFAEELRLIGYEDKIVSFEPLSSAYKKLALKAGRDPKWDCMNIALGAASFESTINVAGNSASSSLLEMLPTHILAAPDSAYIRTEEIRVETLDNLFEKLDTNSKAIWLKIDTQGYEIEVLKGALNALNKITCVQLEMSLVPLYGGAGSLETILAFMSEKGYRLIALHPAFTDMKTGDLLQVNGTFHAAR